MGEYCRYKGLSCVHITSDTWIVATREDAKELLLVKEGNVYIVLGRD